MAPILLLSWRSVAVAVAPFGIPSTAFWIYVCGSLVLVAGLIRTVLELRREHGFDTLMSVGAAFCGAVLLVTSGRS